MDILDEYGNLQNILFSSEFRKIFFGSLNFLKKPSKINHIRDSMDEQFFSFFKDFMNFGFLPNYNHHLECGEYELAANILNQVNNCTLDPLTGLRKKEFISRKLNTLVNEYKINRNSDFSYIMCDLDKFKTVNDNYGHSVGDEVLKTLGSIILDTIRPSDIAFRYGGEEFSILLPNTHISGALKVANRLRESIEDRLVIGNYGFDNFKSFDLSRKDRNVDPKSFNELESFFTERELTSSFGVSNYLDCCMDGDLMLSEADKSLYLAKDNGRNRVEF